MGLCSIRVAGETSTGTSVVVMVNMSDGAGTHTQQVDGRRGLCGLGGGGDAV